MFIKRILFRLLSLDGYLKLVSSFFFRLYFIGALRFKKSISMHYFVRRLIRPGDRVIDIGANLGYYSVIFGKYIGKEGKVFSVEPVKMFREVLMRNLKKWNRNKNVEVIPFALGKENNKQIVMGVPAGSKHFRHGLTHVIENPGQEKSEFEFPETMMRPDNLFSREEIIHYIKCDVEGYEMNIIPDMLYLIEKNKPVIQIETVGENRQKLIELLHPLGYLPHYVHGGRIHKLKGNEKEDTGDVLFLHNDHSERSSGLMA